PGLGKVVQARACQREVSLVVLELERDQIGPSADLAEFKRPRLRHPRRVQLEIQPELVEQVFIDAPSKVFHVHLSAPRRPLASSSRQSRWWMRRGRPPSSEPPRD